MDKGNRYTVGHPLFYGDETHLVRFRESETSYQILLDSIREVLVAQEMMVPYSVRDVFGRHLYLGGVHRQRWYPPLIEHKKSHIDRIIEQYLTQKTEDTNPEVELNLLMSIIGDTPDHPRDHANLRLLMQFHQHASKRGDMSEHSIDGARRYVIDGCYTWETLPQGRDSVFFQLESYLERENSRSLRRTKKGPSSRFAS